MFVIQPFSFLSAQEELRPVGIGSSCGEKKREKLG
jgi:hypothetical protein